MIQDIIVYCIVASAVSYLIYQLVNLIRNRKRASMCGGGCGNCGLKAELVAKK